jgi:transcriptional regulator with XRE-family HTH domain
MRNILGDRLKILRKNLSQAEFASKLGLKQQTYANWENGQREPDLEKVKNIAIQIGVTTDWLLGMDDAKPPDKSIESERPSDLISIIKTMADTIKSQQETIAELKSNRVAPVQSGGGRVTKTA